MSAVFFASCEQFDELESLDGVNYEAEYALPLVDTRISLRELIENVEETTTIIIDENGLVRFQYEGEVITQTSDDIFASINESLPPVIPVSSPRMALPFSTPDGIDIDRIDLKGGELVYFFENRHPERLEVLITLPQVTKNGQPLTFRHNVPAYSGSGTPPRITNFLFPTQLDGYIISPEADSVYIEYEALRGGTTADTLNNFLLRIQELSFTYAQGFFGNQIQEGGRDTIEIDFFDDWVQGDIYFEEPRITFNIENSFGIPTRSVVNVFNILTVQGKVLPLESEFIQKGIDFPYPGIDQVGQTEEKTFTFTRDNSNIAEILGSGPVAIDYDVDALTNPDDDRNITGFITDSSYYRVRVEVDLPLYGRADNFLALDTFELDFTQYENVKTAEFKVVTDNELPLSVDIQAYFLAEDGTVLDSLLGAEERIVQAAPVNEEGISTESVRQVTYAPFEADRFDQIRDARRLALVASFSTLGEGRVSVQPKADQEARIRIGAILGVAR